MTDPPLPQRTRSPASIERQSSAPSKRGWQRLLSLGLFVVSALLLALLLARSDLKKTIANFDNVIPLYILLSFVVRLLNLMLRATRWKLMFKAQGIHFSSYRLFHTLLTSRFVSNFTPMGIGFYAFGLADTTRLTDRRIESVVSTSMNVVVNALVSILIALLATLANWRNPQYVTLKWIVLGISALLGLAWLAFWYLEPSIIAVTNRVHILSRWSFDKYTRRLYEAVRIYQNRENRGLFIQICLLGVCSKGMLILKTYFDIVAFSIHVSIGQLAAVSSVLALVTIVPVVIASLGVGDGLRASIFLLLGVSADSALSIALLQRGLILATDLLGGVGLLVRCAIGFLSSRK